MIFLHNAYFRRLLPLFVVWVNSDSGFFLGPLLVVLFWWGRRSTFRRGVGPVAEVRPPPAWLPLASWAVVLLNPYLFQAFQLPVEKVSPARWLFEKPWDLATWAYGGLLGLLALSFAGCDRQQRVERLALCGPLALGSLGYPALVPFFALLAGPLFLLNLGDFVRRHAVLPRIWLGRWLVGMAGDLLLFLTGTGWLPASRQERLGWEVVPDPSLRRLAEWVCLWRSQEPPAAPPGAQQALSLRLGASHPRLFAYFAWFCPQEKLFFCPRTTSGAWIVDPAITHVLVDDLESWYYFLQNSEKWSLWTIEGRAGLFAQVPTCRALGLSLKPFPVVARAFGVTEEVPNAAGVLAAPGVGSWWPMRPVVLPSRESEAATIYLTCFFQQALPQAQRRGQELRGGYAAGLVAFSSTAWSLFPAGIPLMSRLAWPPPEGEPADLRAWLLLALRAARQALARQPADANAWLRLGQAYWALWVLAGERTQSQGASLLAELRWVQMVTALEQAVRWEPACLPAHRLLAQLYRERGYLDAAVQHERQALALSRRRGPQKGETLQDFQQRGQQEQRWLEEQERQLAARRAALTPVLKTISTTDPAKRAQAAVRLGLVQQALEDYLLPSPAVLLGSAGVQLEFRLLLQLGQAEKLQSILLSADLDEHRDNLGVCLLPGPFPEKGPPLYHLPAAVWFRFLWGAAGGDYDFADKQLQEIKIWQQRRRQHQLPALRRRLARALAAELALFSRPEPLPSQILAGYARQSVMRELSSLVSPPAGEADLLVLRGLLALERGQCRSAAAWLTAANQACASQEGSSAAFPLQFLAASYYRALCAVREK